MARRTGYSMCTCGKRDYGDEHDAERALGRVTAKRRRIRAAVGTARGMKFEQRAYECDFGGRHLTSMSRREYEEVAA